MQWRGCAPPRGDEPGAWGSPVPDILFLHESCLLPRHHPLPETRVSPRPLAWLSHSPPGHAGCMAKGDNMRLCCRSAGHDPGATTGNAGERRNQGTGTPPPRGGRRPARPRHAPAPTPASASQRHFCSSPRLDPDTRKKKKKDTCALKSAPWPRPQRLFPNKALCRPPGPCAHHTLQGGCLPPGHWPLPPSSCWLGGLVGPSSWAPRSQPCVLGTRTLGSTGWPQRGAARPGAPEGGLRAPQHLLQGLCQQRRTPCWWVGFWKTLELHTLERCRRWGGGWQWGAGVPPVCSRGATGAPLLAVSPCLSQLWVPRCRPLVGGWDARVRAPRPWALPGCGCGLYLGVRGLPHPYHASAVTC